jgi:predicted O-methyltransferase YrrM
MSMLRPELWLVPEATKFLSKIVRPEFRVLETGAGGSTIWFARRCASVVSYEHSAAWYGRVKVALDKEGLKNVDLRFRPEYGEKGIEVFPGKSFDLILVDGVGRCLIISRTIGLLKNGGYLVLDNSDRTKERQYGPALSLLDSLGWDKKEFSIFKPGRAKLWRTAIWKKP